jgi:hypothetical protein
MSSEGVLKHFLAAFVLALVGYGVFYTAIEHRRTRKGPWEVTFTNTPAGVPAVVIEQARLGISNVQLSFEAKAPPTAAFSGREARWVFREARPVPFEVPYGRCVFLDTTFLPGTVTLELFGHEIEMLPRVLVIDGQERQWQAGGTIRLGAVQPARRSAEETNAAKGR